MPQFTVDETTLKAIISEAVAKAVEDKMEASIERAVHNAFAQVGLRVETFDQAEDSRKDITFLRWLRTTYESASAKVGGAVIMAVVAGFLGLIWIGFQIAVTAKTGAPR